MTIQERLGRTRAELERQEAEEVSMPALYKNPSTWREGEPGQEEWRSDVFREDKSGEVVAEFYSPDAGRYARYFVRARNLNPARLAVARGELEYAIERRDDLSASSADWNVSPDDKAAMLDEMFDGNGGLSIAECLLGLESAS